VVINLPLVKEKPYMNISIPEFLKTKYNESNICHMTGGGTNELYLVSNESMTRLVKIAGLNSDDIVNEYNTLQLLSEMSVVPKVYELFYIGERDGIEIEFIKGKSMT